MLVSNYRPISLLPLISKIMERIVHNSMLNFLLFKQPLVRQTNWFLTQELYSGGPSPCHPLLAPWLSLEKLSSVGAVFFYLHEQGFPKFLIWASSALWRRLTSLVLY